MPKFPLGSDVYVPSSLLPSPDTRDFALTRTTVQGQNSRSARIDIQDADGNDIEIATKRLHGPHLGVTVLRIGDLRTEANTLDPLAKSILHYLRLLLEPNSIRLHSVRTSIEIQRVWAVDEPVTSHLVVIGHGRADSIRLLDCSKPVSGGDFGSMLESAHTTGEPKTVLSLSCLTGRQPFAKPFSETRVCADFHAPYQSVHSAAASLYAQSFFANHLLNGVGVLAAHRKARAAVGTAVSFRHWRGGKLSPS